MLLRLVLIAAIGLSLDGAVGADKVIDRIESRYNAARSLSLAFAEGFEIQGHRRPPEEGTLVLRKQGKMRWNYTKPAGKLFVSDGKTVYLYSAGENRVEKMPMRETTDMRAPLAFLLGHLDLKKDFRNFAVRPGEGGTWLDAEAKSDRTPYEKVAMLMTEEGAIRELQIHGRDGSLLQFRFWDEKLNPPMDDSQFEFAIPPGAEVVNAVGFATEGR